MGKIKLLPGKSISGSGNDRHGKWEILNIKDFYEQDSHVMPEGLKETHVAITEGIDNVWYEYAPADLGKEEHVPLIISLHGGGQDGYGQCYATSWTLLADQYRFVVIFPSASEGRRWNVDPEGPDFRLIEEVLRYAKDRYGIDEGRVFLQGMSMGNMMTAALAKERGELFAGAGMAAGPDSVAHITNQDYDFGRHPAIPVFLSRGERDRLIPRNSDCGITDRYELNKADREFWLKVNGCEDTPSVIKVEGRNNFFVYDGPVTKLIYRDVKGRGHGQTIDDAECVWRYCFSGSRRNAHKGLVIGRPLEQLKTDAAVILGEGCRKAYVNSVKREMEAGVYAVREHLEAPEDLKKTDPTIKDQDFGPYVYAPVSFLAEAFGLSLEYTYEGHGAVLSSSGPKLTLEVSEGNVACLWNGVLSNMERQAEYRDGILFMPVRDLAQCLGRTVIMQDGVVYITDHGGELTADSARYIKELLG